MKFNRDQMAAERDIFKARMAGGSGGAVPLRARVGADGGGSGRGPGYPRRDRAEMDAMLASVGGAPGIRGGVPVSGQACAPMNYPKNIIDSVAAKQCPESPEDLPPGITPEQARYFHALVNTAKYALAAPRTGWQCDSLTLTTITNAGVVPAIAAGAAFTINTTPTRTFAADSLVSAAGTSSDTVFFMFTLSYDSTNYIDNAPWISTLYTGEAACCLCVRYLKIVQFNTTLTLTGFNGPTANLPIWVQLFGETLYSGNP
jgi:hypothetical protein